MLNEMIQTSCLEPRVTLGVREWGGKGQASLPSSLYNFLGSRPVSCRKSHRTKDTVDPEASFRCGTIQVTVQSAQSRD